MQINQVSINMVHYLYQHRFLRKHRESVKVEEQQNSSGHHLSEM